MAEAEGEPLPAHSFGEPSKTPAGHNIGHPPRERERLCAHVSGLARSRRLHEAQSGEAHKQRNFRVSGLAGC